LKKKGFLGNFPYKQPKQMKKKVFLGKIPYKLWRIASGARRLCGRLPRAPEKQNTSARRLLPATMLDRLPQVCRVKITLELILAICFISTTAHLTKCLVNWIPLNTHVRQTNLTIRVVPSRNISRIQTWF